MGDPAHFNMQQHQAHWHNFTQQQQQKGQTIPQQVIAKAPPPPTTNDAAVRQAKEDALRQERNRQGRRSTILAGASERQDGAMGASQSGSGVGRTTLGG